MTPVLLEVSTPFRLLRLLKGTSPMSSRMCRAPVTATVSLPPSAIWRYPTRDMLARGRSATTSVFQLSPARAICFGPRVHGGRRARHYRARAEPHPVARVRLRLDAVRDAPRDGELAGLVQRDHEHARRAVGLLCPRIAQVQRKADHT